jgi:hypothetical protein
MTGGATLWAHEDRGGGAVSLARVRSLIVIGVLALIAVITVVWAIATDSQAGSLAARCAAAKPSIPAPKEVRVRVYNGTDQSGLATKVQKMLQQRGFKVIAVGNDPENEPISATAQIRYGSTGAGAAELLQASVQGSQIVDDDRTENAVDLVLGVSFTALTPEKQIPAELANLEPPEVATPAGC